MEAPTHYGWLTSPGIMSSWLVCVWLACVGEVEPCSMVGPLPGRDCRPVPLGLCKRHCETHGCRKAYWQPAMALGSPRCGLAVSSGSLVSFLSKDSCHVC